MQGASFLDGNRIVVGLTARGKDADVEKLPLIEMWYINGESKVLSPLPYGGGLFSLRGIFNFYKKKHYENV